jgi:hypothetical protein
MNKVEHLNSVAARLRAISDSAPTLVARTELLDLAKEYDSLAEIAKAEAEQRVSPAGNA